MFIREIILICYLIGIILGVSGLTTAVLAYRRERSELSFALIGFCLLMLVMCCYDMAIYYCDYVIGGLSSQKILRIGNCIIAATMLMWSSLQIGIGGKGPLKIVDSLVQKYLVFYIALWMLLTVFLSIKQFYTLKWMLLATDIALIVLVLASSVGHMIFTAVQGRKYSFHYMVTVTAVLIWNYISYFWGEASVYWGNSDFIRAPLDLTIIFWLIVNAATLVYGYRYAFLPAFRHESVKEQEQNGGRTDTKSRIEEICSQYGLTPREKELIELIYSGLSNREIAEKLYLSESTVKTHIYNIFRKLDVRNRVSVICMINGEFQDDETDKKESCTDDSK